MKLVIHNVNIPSILKYKGNLGIMETAEIKFGDGTENFMADIELDFDKDNFVISNKFLNSKESLIITANNKTCVIDRYDFENIEIK